MSVRQRPLRQRMTSIRQRSRSVRQRLYVSSPTSKLKLLFENNCQIDNPENTYCYLFGNGSSRKRVSLPRTSLPTKKSIHQRSRSVRQRLYVSSPTSKLKLLFENNCQIDNPQFTYYYLFGNRSFHQCVSSPTNEVDSPTCQFANAGMTSIRQRSRSVRQRLYVSSPTSKLKLLLENNCQIDNLEFT